MHVQLITVAYDSGHCGVRMGQGPTYLVEHGMAEALAEHGHEVRVTEVECTLDPPTEVAMAFDLARSIALTVRQARDGGWFPLVLAGNCFSSVGTVAGLGASHTAALWLDAHGDLHTPETTATGFIDGMAAATLTGRCWRTLTAEIPRFIPLPDYRFGLVGARALDPAETALMTTVGIPRATPDTIRRRGVRAAMGPVLAATSHGIDGYYLHIDLDVLDPEVTRANGFAVPGGLSVEEVVEVAEEAAGTVALAGAAIAAFDPSSGDAERATDAAIRIAQGVARCRTVRREERPVGAAKD